MVKTQNTKKGKNDQKKNCKKREKMEMLFGEFVLLL